MRNGSVKNDYTNENNNANNMSNINSNNTSVLSAKQKLKNKSSSNINAKVNRNNNEFLNNQLDPEKFDEYIEMLQEFEKTCIAEKRFKDAELAAERIKELKTQESEYRTIIISDKHKQEVEDLEKLTLSQFNDFNKMWDDLLQEHMDNMKKIEQELADAHKEEQTKFDEEVEGVTIPKPKFSKEYINQQAMLQNLIKAKKYSEAQEISDKIDQMEKIELDRWNSTYREKFTKKKQQLLSKQKIEMDALRVKLENSLQEKLRMRGLELQKLLQRFQNMKKELEFKQNQELSKMKLMNQKNKSAMASKSNLSFIASQPNLDRSNILETRTPGTLNKIEDSK